MRITAEAKQETRSRILEISKRLFRDHGFEETTVRDIAREVGMATGTLFNYFRSKEEVAIALAEEALEKARLQFRRKRHQGATLQEDLFLHVSTQLRALRPIRQFINPVIESALATPFPESGSESSRRMRTEQIETVSSVLNEHTVDPERWSMTVPIYWSLYVGVLAFWGHDSSPKQEDSLAMLDQSINMFVAWLETAG